MRWSVRMMRRQSGAGSKETLYRLVLTIDQLRDCRGGPRAAPGHRGRKTSQDRQLVVQPRRCTDRTALAREEST